MADLHVMQQKMQSGKVLSDRSDSKSCPSETKIFESLALSNKAVTCQQIWSGTCESDRREKTSWGLNTELKPPRVHEVVKVISHIIWV